MIRFLARGAATLALALALVVPAAPALAEVERQHHQSAPMFDLLVLRPLGLGATAVGLVLMVPAAVVMTVIGQPDEMSRPWNTLVAEPARFTFSDPIGSH